MDDFTPDLAGSSLPPQNIEAEEIILGSILFDPNAMGKVVDILQPEAFYVQAYRHIYEAARTLYFQGQPIDLMTVSTWLSDQGLLEKVGGNTKIISLLDRTVSAANIERYVPLITEKYIRRLLISTAKEIGELGFDTTKDLDNVLDESEQKIFSLTQARIQEGLVPISTTLIDTFTEIQAFQEKTALPGISSEFYDLDGMTGGFQRSDLIIIAARPSMGKTSFALNIASNIAKHSNLAVAIFSLEMSREQLAMRLLSSESRVESNRLKSGRITEQEMEPLMSAMGTLAELPIYIDDTANLTVMQMRSQVRRLQAESKGKLGLVLLDYLQLMQGGGDNRVQELSKMTRALKGLAREINAPVIALSQLSRAVEQRTNKRPMLSDLRESGCLSGDSLVTMADSGEEIPIRDLAGKSDFAIWALNEKTMKMERALVSNAFCTGIKPIWQITTELGRTIKATANHKFLRYDGWQRLDCLQKGDRISMPRFLPNPQTQTITNDELALLGHLIGDGCTLPSHSIQYTTRELDLAHMVVKLATKIFGNEIKPNIKLEKKWYQVYLTSNYHLYKGTKNPITKWLENLSVFGLRSYQKFIPDLIFKQSENAITIFLRHLWSTDGCIHLSKNKSHYPSVYYTSSSEKLTSGVQTLLLRLGINATVKEVNQGTKGRKQYQVWVTGKSEINIFINKIGAVSSEKKQIIDSVNKYILSLGKENTNRDIIPSEIWTYEVKKGKEKLNLTERKLQALVGSNYCGSSFYKRNISRTRANKIAYKLELDRLERIANSDMYWDKIKTIEFIGNEKVYDLTVPNLHNFVAQNIYVHNSIEQDADLVLMLYRDEYYNPDSVDQGVSEIIVAKHRNGPTGLIKLLFRPEFTQFLNMKRGG
ncbi:MAG: replicative DNA helicase [Cyanobacterium sp.]